LPAALNIAKLALASRFDPLSNTQHAKLLIPEFVKNDVSTP